MFLGILVHEVWLVEMLEGRFHHSSCFDSDAAKETAKYSQQWLLSVD